jgi:hypothetical protein
MPWGNRCGYVGIEPTHPLWGAPFNEPAEALATKAEEVKSGPIGKRGILSLFAAALDEKRLSSPESVFDVHGSITYSGFGTDGYPVPSPMTFWYGFDCGHYGDARDPELMDEKYKGLEERYLWYSDGIIRSFEYVMAECESLAKQLSEVSR